MQKGQQMIKYYDAQVLHALSVAKYITAMQCHITLCKTVQSVYACNKTNQLYCADLQNQYLRIFLLKDNLWLVHHNLLTMSDFQSRTQSLKKCLGQVGT